MSSPFSYKCTMSSWLQYDKKILSVGCWVADHASVASPPKLFFAPGASLHQVTPTLSVESFNGNCYPTLHEDFRCIDDRENRCAPVCVCNHRRSSTSRNRQRPRQFYFDS